MSLPEVSLENLIDYTSAGVQCANFVQIKSALIKKYKEIYGSDIDLSTGTADGVWVHYIGLIINNILQSVNQLYSNLDVNYATGSALDALCSLSNITRKGATYSTASISLQNLLNTTNLLRHSTQFVDKYGSIWIYDGDDLTFTANQTKSITVRAEEKGAIYIEANCIYQTVEAGLNFSISQPNECIVGLTAESDEDLRARRNQSNSSSGVTVLESLNGALRNISGVEDVKIYNIMTGTETVKDGTDVSSSPHTSYICIRYNNVSDSTIGELIYSKMTPGIPTLQSAITSGRKSYTVYLSSFDTSLTEVIKWKKCEAIHPTITISYTKLSTFTSDEVDSIKESIFKYLNNLQIGEDIKQQDLIAEVIYSDPQYRGKPTYTAISATITGADSSGNYINPDTYYNYTSCTPNADFNTLTFA